MADPAPTACRMLPPATPRPRFATAPHAGYRNCATAGQPLACQRCCSDTDCPTGTTCAAGGTDCTFGTCSVFGCLLGSAPGSTAGQVCKTTGQAGCEVSPRSRSVVLGVC